MESESFSFGDSFQRRTERPMCASACERQVRQCSQRSDAGACPSGCGHSCIVAASTPLSKHWKRIEKPHPPMIREDGGISREQC